jgi:aspartyl-tRNA(Asn)/glutamyl-tRNA(Gln) amidotransferase subunit C
MDPDVVLKVAKLARLDLSEEEVEEFSRDLEEILGYFSILDEAPSTSEFDFNPVPIRDVLREDEPGLRIDPGELRDLMKAYQDWIRGPRLS